MSTRALSEAEYLETFGQPMRQAAKDEAPPFDFWDYFESIPPEYFASHDCNVFMVLVLDRQALEVYGHRLLDLNELYGLTHRKSP